MGLACKNLATAVRFLLGALIKLIEQINNSLNISNAAPASTMPEKTASEYCSTVLV